MEGGDPFPDAFHKENDMLMKLLIPATLAAGLCVPVALKGGFHGELPGAMLESRLKLNADVP